ILFTDNRFYGTQEAIYKRLFDEFFPHVYEVYSMIKSKGKNVLPILLQKIESRIILNHVCRRIAREQPTLPIFTIHDSVVCPDGYQEYVEGIMRDEFKKNLGIPVKVGFEILSPDHLEKV
ncbi:MAG: hypothetical protein ACHQK8_04630, partial [Bacteroidia bacterium]